MGGPLQRRLGRPVTAKTVLAIEELAISSILCNVPRGKIEPGCPLLPTLNPLSVGHEALNHRQKSACNRSLLKAS